VRISGDRVAGGKGNINWRIEVKPDPKVIQRAYGDLAKKLVDWSPALERLVPIIVRGLVQNFASRGTSLGEQWAPLTKKYAERKARKGLGRVMLQRTGRLRGDITTEAGVLSLTKRSLKFGTRLPYARAVQFGQRRVVLGWTPGMSGQATEIMSAHAAQLVEQASARIASAGG